MSELQSASSATVHGVFVGAVSPVRDSRSKKGVKYFEGNLSDGEKRVRVVAFDSKLHQRIVTAQREEKSVALEGCVVQNSKWRPEELEIIANARTKMEPSPKRFKVDGECSELTPGPPGNHVHCGYPRLWSRPESDCKREVCEGV